MPNKNGNGNNKAPVKEPEVIDPQLQVGGRKSKKYRRNKSRQRLNKSKSRRRR